MWIDTLHPLELPVAKVPLTVTNTGAVNVYYKPEPTVSGASHEGVLAPGASVEIFQTTWFIGSAGGGQIEYGAPDAGQDGEPFGSALLGSDGTVGGPGGSPLSTTVVTGSVVRVFSGLPTSETCPPGSAAVVKNGEGQVVSLYVGLSEGPLLVANLNPAAGGVLGGSLPNPTATSALLGVDTLIRAYGRLLPASGANTRFLSKGGEISNESEVQEPIPFFELVAADFALPAGNPKAHLRLRGLIECNATAPGGTYKIALVPVTVEGGSEKLKYKAGAPVAELELVASASKIVTATGVPFTLPADGTYALAVINTAKPNAGAIVGVQAAAQVVYE